MTTQSIKVRILRNVKDRIQHDVNSYICYALDDIEAQDHRRNVHRICEEIRADVQHHLAPCKTFGDKLPKARSLKEVKQARLAWLDKQIALYQEPTHA
jgi:hypothetical protein